MEFSKGSYFFVKNLIPIFIFEIFYLFLDKRILFFLGQLSIPFAKWVSYLILPPLHLIVWGAMLLIAWVKRAQCFILLFQIILSQSIAVIFASLFKAFLGRARPEIFLQKGLYGFYGLNWERSYHSFPSGHALTAFTFATSLCLAYPRFKPLFFSLAALFSLSRLFLLEHYLSDLFGSALIGIVVAHFAHKITRKIKYETV